MSAKPANRRAHHPADDLSFTRLRSRAEYEGTDLLLRCWWSVTPSGDYAEECQVGSRIALEYLAYLEANNTPGCLGWIVGDMPNELSGVEIGFLSVIDVAVRAGRARAQAVAKFWEQAESKEAAE